MNIAKTVSYYFLILLLGGVILLAQDAALAVSGKICRGLVVAGVPVGSLPAGEAEAKVADALREKRSHPPAVLQFGGVRWEVGMDAVSGYPDAAVLIQEAYSIGRKGTLPERLREQFLALHGGKAVVHALTADADKLRRIVETAAATVDLEPVDASLAESADGIRFLEERNGRRTDVEGSLRNLVLAVETGNPPLVALVVQDRPPAVRMRDLAGIDGILSAFSTSYDAADENRSRNIRIAAEILNGTLIRSGEEFSFNGRVGERTKEKGYTKAPVLSSEGVVLDWGGGVCQVSSTLYNAALLADFSIVERSAHYHPPLYVPLGLDATVADGQIDLKLKNERKSPVYLISRAGGGTLEVRLYGKVEPGAPSVQVEPLEKIEHAVRTVVVQDPHLPYGQEIIQSPGVSGYSVTVYRIKRQGKQEIGREKISVDDFAGTDRVIRVGTRTKDGSTPK